MAHGLMEMKEAAAAKHASLYDVESRIQYFLDRFYLMRISIRLLIHQHCESPLTSLSSKFLLYQSSHTCGLLACTDVRFIVSVENFGCQLVPSFWKSFVKVLS